MRRDSDQYTLDPPWFLRGFLCAPAVYLLGDNLRHSGGLAATRRHPQSVNIRSKRAFDPGEPLEYVGGQPFTMRRALYEGADCPLDGNSGLAYRDGAVGIGRGDRFFWDGQQHRAALKGQDALRKSIGRVAGLGPHIGSGRTIDPFCAGCRVRPCGPGALENSVGRDRFTICMQPAGGRQGDFKSEPMVGTVVNEAQLVPGHIARARTATAIAATRADRPKRNDGLDAADEFIQHCLRDDRRHLNSVGCRSAPPIQVYGRRVSGCKP